MRIGFDITDLYVVRAGIYYYKLNLLRHLLDLDSEHQFVLLDYAPVRGTRSLAFDVSALESERVRYVEIKGPRQRKLINWKRMDFFGGRFAAQRVDALLERPWRWFIERRVRHDLDSVLDDLDVLHTSEVVQFESARLPTVSTVYDLTPLLFPQWHTEENRLRFERKMRHVIEREHQLIAISDHTKQDLVKNYGVPADRIHVVYSGVSPQYRPILDWGAIQRVLDKYGLTGRDYILYVGTLEPRKNLVRLVEAYAAILEWLGDGLPPLVLAGSKGWFYDEVFATVERLGLQQRVVFTGFVEDADLPALFNGAVIFVYPSLYEGFGMPVLEAMACGVPVVTSRVSSLSEVVDGAGALVDPQDTGAIGAALIDLLQNPQRRQELGTAGLARSGLFSWERAARETLAIYQATV